MSALDKLPRAGKVYRYKKLLFWAQGGLVCIEDTSDEGDFRVCSRAEFVARVITVRRLLERDSHRYADERNEDWNFLTNGPACVKEAKRQGDPFDPRVMEEVLARHRRSYVYTGTAEGHVVFDPVTEESGGVTQRFHFDPSKPSRSVALHTVPADRAPAQAAFLPPVPQKGVKPPSSDA